VPGTEYVVYENGRSAKPGQQQMGFLHPRDFQLDVQLSKHPYDRHDSDGFMPRTEIVGFFALVPPGI
jgi:hypothetical protein